MANSQLLVSLPTGLRADLDAFCEANLGAPAAHVIRAALRDYIDNRLEAEPALRTRYLHAKQQKVSSLTEPIRLVNGKTKKPG